MKIGCIGGVVSVLLLAGAALAGDGEMVANGGFERGREGWTLPKAWKIEDGVGRNGSKALVWENEDPKHYAFPVYRVAFEPGGIYRFGAWVKVEKGDEKKVAVSIDWSDANGKWLGSSYAHPVTDNDPNTKGWTHYTGISRSLPSGAAKGNVLCYAHKGCTGRVLFDDFTLVPQATRMIEYLQCSAYHNTFSSEDGVIRFAAALHVNTVKNPLRAIKGVFTMKLADGRTCSRTVPVFDADRAEMAVEAAAFPVGTQEVTFRIVRDGKDLDSAKLRVTKTERPVKRRVAIDARGRALLEGKPFFPLGMYTGRMSDEDLAVWKQAGFNFAMQYGPITPQDLDRWQAAGTYAATDVRSLIHGYNYSAKSRYRTPEESQAAFRKRYAEIGRHPALFAWYLVDEAPLEFVPNIAMANGFLHEIDPDHPTYTVTDKPWDVRSLLPCYDVIGMDPYPIGNHGGRARIEICSQWTDETREGMFDLRTMWHVPQAFNWGWYRPDEVGKTPNLRFPTRQEYANMTWQGIAGGANGLCSYAFHSMRKNLKGEAFDRAWGDVCAVTREVKALVPVLLSDGDPMHVGGVPKDLIVRTYAHGGKDWALVVNRTGKPVAAKLTLPRAYAAAETAAGGGVTLAGDTLDVALDGTGYAFVALKPVPVKPAAIAWYGEKCRADVFRRGLEPFTDLQGWVEVGNTIVDEPSLLKGRAILRAPEAGCTIEVLEDGELYLLTCRKLPSDRGGVKAHGWLYEKAGWRRALAGTFQLWGGRIEERVETYRKVVKKGEKYALATYTVVAGFDPAASHAVPMPVIRLPNGLEMAEDPRARTDFRAFRDGTPEVPYLKTPPKRIDVTVGRQLFVDDFLIDSTTMRRTWHKPVIDARSPVLKPETPLERGAKKGHNPMAAPFSGGVWYDGAAKRFACYYRAGWYSSDALAFSDDGIHWTRPDLGVEKGTNRIVPLPNGQDGGCDSSAVVLDPDAADGYRWKMLVWYRPYDTVAGQLYRSKDGISWEEPVACRRTGDRSTIFYNPFAKRWVYSIRSYWHERSREYADAADFLDLARLGNAVPWFYCDDKDLRAKSYVWYDPTVKGEPIKPALYNFDSVAYESLMVAVATVWQGPENFMYDRVGLPKPSDLHLAFSRNGFDYSRPDDRTPFLACSRRKGDWNAGYLHSNAGVCLVNGDELWFYFTGFAGDPKRLKRTSSLLEDVGTYANASMGLARLRRDGFCSMDADGDATLVTRPLVFREGDRLFVNANVRGCLAAEILDEDGRTLDGFALADAKPLHGDSCKAELAWKGGFLSFGANRSLASLRGRPVRIRFKAHDAELYSFWFSDETGRSRGYLGGGSPGHATLRDE